MNLFQRINCLLLAIILVLAAALPSSALLTKAEEKDIGREAALSVARHNRIVEDPYLHDYFKRMASEISATIGSAHFEHRLAVVNDPSINGFAIPGGYVYLTSRLVLAAKDESELAGVIAHELGHVEGRHLAYRLEKSKKVNLAGLAGMLAGALIAGSSPEAGSAIATSAMAGMQAKMLQYSREDEEDADRVGLDALMKAGYDGWGMVRFMETLRESSAYGGQIPTYLLTHPPPTNRAAYLAASLEGKSGSPDKTDMLPVIQGRILLKEPPPWGAQYFEERVERSPEDPMLRVGFASVLRGLGRYDDARAQLEVALGIKPNLPVARHEEGVIAFRSGDTGRGVESLKHLAASENAHPAVLLDLAWMLSETGDDAGALELYEMLESEGYGYLPFKYDRGVSLGKMGRKGEAHAELGFYHRARGSRTKALSHLKEARKLLPPGQLKDRVKENIKLMREEKQER